MKLKILSVVLATSPNFAYADEAATKACTDVYKNSTRNFSELEQNKVELARSYSSFCKRDGSVNTSASGIGLEAVVKAIPFKFSATSSNSSQKLEEFCKVGQSQFDSWNSSNFASSSVATDALSNFNNCMQIANSGLQLTFSINQPSNLVVSGYANAGYSGHITSIAYDDQNMECTSADFNSEHKSEKLYGAAHIKISDPFAITCTKKSSLAADGSTRYYPRTTLTLTASAVSPLAIVFPSDTLNGFELSSQAGLAVAQASSEVAAAKSALSAQTQISDSLQKRIDGVDVTVTTHELGSGTSWGCGPYGADWGRGILEEAQKVCGSNKFKLGSNNVRGGGTCGYGSIGFSCVIVPK
ncbi:hypothetical protein [Methylobacterium longum]|uniref:DUF4189 domain-containing protein n=1 Tax=Methylobacterium longum TaxID=767694 RepID=A0ABT8B091_9HYPH|nr:hypothetical protein [Methylobacterium longum]MDN3575135.1 hypothetical protein [Methylobacterium longum]GJE14796.1 hypothetical protein FOHLNKBM_5871 [Methylobacterium longum]